MLPPCIDSRSPPSSLHQILKSSPCSQHLWETLHVYMWEIIHVKEQTRMLLIKTWHQSSNWTKLALKPLTGNNLTASLFPSCVLLLSCRLYYFSLHDDYPPFLQLVHYTICLHSSTTISDNKQHYHYWPWTTNLF